MPTLLADGRRNAGRNLVALVVRTWDEAGTRHPILILLRAAMTEPQVAEMLRGFLSEELLSPLMAELGSDQPELRTDLALSQLIGMAIARHIIELEPLASLDADEVVDAVGPTVQRYLTGKIEQREEANR
jgi:Tetracyclin repressor-like, C-terminal domain